MATADLTVIGLGRPDPSAGAYVAAIQRRPSEQDKFASLERRLLAVQGER